MSRYSHHTWYDVTNFSGYFYQNGKWTNKPDYTKDCCTGKRFWNYNKAKHSAYSCPCEMIIIKWYVKHGQVWQKEIIIGALKK